MQWQFKTKDSCRDGSYLRVGTEGYGRLCIDSVTRASMGPYYCIASNGIPPTVSKKIQLVVLCELFASSFKDCRCIQVFTTDCSSLFLLSSYVTLYSFLISSLFRREPMCDELIVLVPFSFHTVAPNVHAERRSLTVGVHQIIVLECSVEASPPTAHHLWHKGSMYSIYI